MKFLFVVNTKGLQILGLTIKIDSEKKNIYVMFMCIYIYIWKFP